MRDEMWGEDRDEVRRGMRDEMWSEGQREARTKREARPKRERGPKREMVRGRRGAEVISRPGCGELHGGLSSHRPRITSALGPGRRGEDG